MKWSETQSQNQDADCVGATVAYITFAFLLVIGVCMFASLAWWISR